MPQDFLFSRLGANDAPRKRACIGRGDRALCGLQEKVEVFGVRFWERLSPLSRNAGKRRTPSLVLVMPGSPVKGSRFSRESFSFDSRFTIHVDSSDYESLLRTRARRKTPRAPCMFSRVLVCRADCGDEWMDDWRSLM